MIGLLIILVILFAALGWLFVVGAGRNRTDSEGNLTPLNYFDRIEPQNRAARRARR